MKSISCINTPLASLQLVIKCNRWPPDVSMLISKAVTQKLSSEFAILLLAKLMVTRELTVLIDELFSILAVSL